MTQRHLAAALVVSLVLPAPMPARAGDVVFDGTIGPSAAGTAAPTLPGSPTTFDIQESLGERAGDNLFHSFTTFNIDSGETALFTGDAAITNIVSRVTGGAASLLNGTIQNDIAGAAFWFVNPAGVVVGADAQFDGMSALHIGAVDYLQFANGERLYAVPGGTEDISLLSFNPVSFGFVTGSTTGGDITWTDDAALSLAHTHLTAAGDISVSAASLDVAQSTITTTAVTNDGGDIALTATDGDVFIHDGAFVSTGSIAEGAAGDIDVTATEQVRLNVDENGATLVEPGVLVRSVVGGNSRGVGSVRLEGADVLIAGANLSSNTSSSVADLGGVPVAPAEIRLSATGGADSDGIVDVRGSSMSVDASGAAPGSHIVIESVDRVSLTSNRILAGAFATGAAGDVSISADDVVMAGGSIEAESAPGAAATGSGGDISITGTSSVAISNALLETPTFGAGSSGSISITSGADGSVTLTDTRIQATAGDPGDPEFTPLAGDIGNAGSVTIGGGSIAITGGYVKTEAFANDAGVTGSAGDVFLSGVESVAIGGATVSSATGDSGNAGNVRISAQSIAIGDAAVVQASSSATGAGGGLSGSITLYGDTVSITEGSLLSTASATDQIGFAGGIDIFGFSNFGAQSLTIADSDVLASSSGLGQAGYINLRADFSLGTVSISNASITSLANGGNAGAISIEGAEIDILGSLFDTSSVLGNAGYIYVYGGDLGVSSSTLQASSAAGGGCISCGGVPLFGGGIYLYGFATGGDVALNGTTVDTTVGGTAGSNTIVIYANDAVSLVDSILTNTTTGSGDAGDIDVYGTSFAMAGGELVTSAAGTGDAGDITIQGTNYVAYDAGTDQYLYDGLASVMVSGGADIRSDAAGLGAVAGAIRIGASPLLAGYGSTDPGPTISIGGATDADYDGLSGPALEAELDRALAEISSSSAQGGAGSVTIRGQSVELTNALVSTSTGSATPVTEASIDVAAAGAVTLTDSGLVASTSGVANAGDIALEGTSVTIAGVASTVVRDGLGAPVVDGDGQPVFETHGIEATSTATGATGGLAGSIALRGDAIAITDGALLSTATASDQIGFSGQIEFFGKDDFAFSSLDVADSAITSSSSGLAQAGSISFNGEYATGSSATFSNADIASSNTSNGSAGSINLYADTVSISDGSSFDSSSAEGNAGYISIGGDVVDVSGSALQASSAEGAGCIGDCGGTPLFGGGIYLSAYGTTGDLSITDSTIDTTVGGTAAFNTIYLYAQDALAVSGTTLANATTGSGSAGEITLFANTIDLAGTQAMSTSSGAGNAGNIAVYTTAFTMAGGELASSASGAGDAGDVTLQGPTYVAYDAGTNQSLYSGLQSVALSDGADIRSDAAGADALAGAIRIGPSPLLADYGSTDPGPTISISGATDADYTGLAGDALEAELDRALAEISSSSAQGGAGTVLLTGTSIDLTNTLVSTSTGSATPVTAASIGLLSSGAVTLVDSGLVASTSGAANAGSILLDGTSVSIAGRADQVQRDVGGVAVVDGDGAPVFDARGLEATSTATGATGGLAGSIAVYADAISISDGALLSTATASDQLGFSGAIVLQGGEFDALTSLSVSDSAITSSSSGLAQAGSISIYGVYPGSTLIFANADVTSNNTDAGSAGSINVFGGTIDVGAGSVFDSSSSLGNAGYVSIGGAGLSITGSELRAASAEGAGCIGDCSGELPLFGGSIYLSAYGPSADLTITDSIVDTTVGGTAGGNAIYLYAEDALALSGSHFTNTTTGAGDAGSINLFANTIALANTEATSTSSGNGNAGTIEIYTTAFTMAGGELATSASGAGNAGRITLQGTTYVDYDPGTNQSLYSGLASVVLSDGADIRSDAAGAGALAGAVRIGPSPLLADYGATDPGPTISISGAADADYTGLTGDALEAELDRGLAEISSSSALGGAGTVLLRGTSIDLANALVSTSTGSATPVTPASIGLLSSGAVALTNSGLVASTSGAANAGSIVLEGTSVDIAGSAQQARRDVSGNVVVEDGAPVFDANGLEATSTQPGATGGLAGSILVKGDTITVTDGAVLATTTASDQVDVSGTAGSITLQGLSDFDAADIDVADSTINSSSTGLAQAGFINLYGDFETAQVSFTNAQVTSRAAAGNAGFITVYGQRIDVTGQSLFDTSSDLGAAGYVFLYGADGVDVADSFLSASAGEAASAESCGSGTCTGGSIYLYAFQPDGTVNVSGSVIDTTVGGTAANNAIYVYAPGAVTLTDSVLSNTTTGSGNAGQIFVYSDTVALNGTEATSSSSGSGDAGTIDVYATTFTMAGGELATSATGSGDAGDITLQGTTYAGFDPDTFDSLYTGLQSVVLTDGADIRSDAAGVGAQAGAILIGPSTRLATIGVTDAGPTISIAGAADVDYTGLSGDALASEVDRGLAEISSSSAQGGAGTVELRGTSIDLTNALVSTSTGSATPTAPASIVLDSSGPVSLTGAGLVASTSGAANAGNIAVAGTTVDIAGTAGDALRDENGELVVDDGGAPQFVARGIEATSTQTGVTGGLAGSIEVRGDAISITDGALLSTTTASDQPGTGAGITVRGFTEFDFASLDLRDSAITASSTGLAQAGTINLYGLYASADLTIVNAQVTSRATVGDAGIISVGGNTIDVSGGSVFDTSSTEGAAGYISLSSNASLAVADSSLSAAAARVSSFGELYGGGIYLQAGAVDGDVAIANSTIDTTASGTAGGNTVAIYAGDAVTLTGTSVNNTTTGTGNAGPVNVFASSIAMSGGELATSSTGSGRAGSIGFQGSTFGFDPDTFTFGYTGLGDVTLTDGARVSADTLGTGAGGKVTIVAEGDLVMTGPGTRLSASSAGPAAGGAIEISAANLTLANGARIEATASGTGDSGSIDIVVNNDLTLLSESVGIPETLSAIRTSAVQSGGGDITLRVGDGLTIVDSLIEASAGAAGQGGDIDIKLNEMFMTESLILARADQGNGGSIRINRWVASDTDRPVSAPEPKSPLDGLFIVDAISAINADSKAGSGGNVEVDAPDINVTQEPAPVNIRIIKDPTLEDDACSDEALRERSSFIVEDEGGVAPPPDGYFSAGVQGVDGGEMNAQGTAPPQPTLYAMSGGC